MSRPICANHQIEMRCSKTGELVAFDTDAGPYQVWMFDRYTCSVGGESVLVGPGSMPVAEHFEPTFTSYRQRVGTVVKVA